MLADAKPFVPPVYPKPVIPDHETLKKRYLKTRDFYDLPEEVEFDAYLYQDSFEPVRQVCYKRDARLVIYPKDLVAIYGKAARTCRRYLQYMREEIGLPKGAPVTIRAFCKHSGLPYETVHDFIMES
jgi:hypothetical protein